MEVFYTIGSFDRWQKFRDNFFPSSQNKQSYCWLCRVPFRKEFEDHSIRASEAGKVSTGFSEASSKIACISPWFARKGCLGIYGRCGHCHVLRGRPLRSEVLVPCPLQPHPTLE